MGRYSRLYAVILRTGPQMTQCDPGKIRVKRWQKLPDDFIHSQHSPEGFVGAHVHAPHAPHAPKILWSYKKDQTARLQTLFQTSRTHGVGTFGEKKGTGHYTTALTTLDKLYSHGNSYLLIYFCTEQGV